MEENSLLNEMKEWGKAMFFAFIAAVLINVFVFENQEVHGRSMVPTFHEKERVVVWKIPHFTRQVPAYGDIVIIDSRVKRLRTLADDFIDQALVSTVLNRKNQNFWIKRVIGRPGDLLEFKDGKVYRNGEALNETYVNEAMDYAGEPVRVPKNHIFVMGDNRNNSSDSRVIGPVPLENVRGEVVLRFWPINVFEKF